VGRNEVRLAQAEMLVEWEWARDGRVARVSAGKAKGCSAAEPPPD